MKTWIQPLGNHRKTRNKLNVAMPPPDVVLEQDAEWAVVEIDGEWTKLRVHDYGKIFSVPGLYERLVYDIFKCQSPQVVRVLLRQELDKRGVDPSRMTVLDLGAGNGCVAEELAGIGIQQFVGVDIIEEAAEGAERDRPGLYDDFVVGDLTELPPAEQVKLDGRRFNCMVCVAALGFGDIPPEVFVEAFNQVEDGGWIVFTIKKDFLEDREPTGFNQLIRRILEREEFDLSCRKEFRHRYASNGDSLTYCAFVGRKRKSIPA